MLQNKNIISCLCIKQRLLNRRYSFNLILFFSVYLWIQPIMFNCFASKPSCFANLNSLLLASNTTFNIFFRYLANMYSACLVPREKTKSVLVVWKRCPEWSKQAWVLYLCVRMVEQDTEMPVAGEHTLVNGIYK